MSELGFADRTVPLAATDAARELVGNDRRARWRALPDGSVEVVKPAFRHELHRVYGNGATELLARSPRNWRRYVASTSAIVAFLSVWVIGFTGSRAIAPVFGAIAAAAVVCLLVSPFLPGRSAASWAQERDPTAEWAHVPREGTLDGATGNQLIAATRVADGGVVSARRLDDGTVEVVKGGEMRRISRTGETVEHRTYAPHKPWRARAAGIAAVGALVLAIALEHWPAYLCTLATIASVIAAVVFASREYSLTDDGEWVSIKTDDPGD